jgi:pimeloyl-ACP methyl ester carboxylesterase
VFAGVAAATVALAVVAISAPSLGATSGSTLTSSTKSPASTKSTAVGTSSVAVGTSSTSVQATPVENDDDPDVERVSDTVNAIHVTFVDESRGRTIPVTVYYPVAAGVYPLVVFAHGYASSAATYATLEQDVAAAGFVIAAPDFPLSSTAVTSEPVRDPVAQATDVSFVIDSLLDSATRPTELANRIAATHVGVIGHSDGGITAAGVAYNSDYADSRIGAAVILSGAAVSFPGDWFTTSSPPLLAIHGDADEVNPFGASEAIFDGATGPKWLVKVLGGSHLGPFTTDPSEASVSVLVADFLHAQLEGDAGAASRIDSDAETGSLALVDQG